MVVFHHFSTWFYQIGYITSIAVPCFFMISGYLLWEEKEERFQERVVRSIKRIVKIALLASALYIIIDIIIGYTKAISIGDIVRFLIFNKPIFFGEHLWYLWAYLYVLIINYWLSRWNLRKYMIYLVPILLILMLVVGRYSFLFGEENEWYFDRNFAMTGIPFFGIGMFIKEMREIIREKLKWLKIVMFIFLVLSFLEGYILEGYFSVGNYNISTIMLAISVFLVVILSSEIRWNCFMWIGREMTLYIYIFHYFIGYIFSGWDVIIILVVTILISYIFIKMKSLISKKFFVNLSNEN